MPDPPSAPSSVIIIGAGIAGLASARMLHRADFMVTVLESRDRIGGRIHTDYSFGFPVDMGASWLHGVCEQNPLASVIGNLKLPLYRTSGDNSILYDHDLESYALFGKEGGKVPADLVIKVGEVFKDLLEESRKVREEASEDMSLDNAFSIIYERRPDLRQDGLAQKVLQWYICRMEGWFAMDVDAISLENMEGETLLGGGHGLMVEGYMPVLSFLAEGLDIRFEHRVTSIIQQDGGVQVSTSDGKAFRGDAAVITVPVGVLKANIIEFEPKLPKWKEAAISELGVGYENKVALLFDDVFWPNVEFLGIVASTSYKCNYFLNLHRIIGHPVLVYMPAGRLAKELEQLTDAEAAENAFLELQRMFPSASRPTKYLVSKWGCDENSLGSFSSDAIGMPETSYERLRAPVNNMLFFAGEATSKDFAATVHGAFESGISAASECGKCLDKRWKQVDEEKEASLPLDISRT